MWASSQSPPVIKSLSCAGLEPNSPDHLLLHCLPTGDSTAKEMQQVDHIAKAKSRIGQGDNVAGQSPLMNDPGVGGSETRTVPVVGMVPTKNMSCLFCIKMCFAEKRFKIWRIFYLNVTDVRKEYITNSLFYLIVPFVHVCRLNSNYNKKPILAKRILDTKYFNCNRMSAQPNTLVL